MGLREEVERKYTDEDGLILERPNSGDGPETGNGILGLSVYSLLLIKWGEFQLADWKRVEVIINSCEVGPGLYCRGPRKKEELISHDDYTALAAISYITQLPFAKRIAEYGHKSHFSFNNLHPGKFSFRSWHGRFLGLVPFYKICAGEPISSFEFMAIALRIFLGGVSRNPNGKILTWLMSEAVIGKNGWTDEAVRYWRKKLANQYLFGMRSVFSKYYGPSHPFVKAA